MLTLTTRGDAARKYRTANKVLIGAALALCAVRLAMAAYTGLVDDEAYYRIWSLAPALSYYDHPPMVAWMIGAGRAIAGDTTLGVRLLAPFCHLLGAALLWRTTKLLYGAETARRTVWIMLAMPLLAVGGIIITPDLPSVLFAGLVLWALAELDRSQNANWWLAIGLFAGLGLISKYTNLFLGATIVIWLVAVSSNHKWLRAPQLWIGGLIAMAVTSPVVIWNAEHDWVSFAKQFGRVAHNGSAGPGYLLGARRRVHRAREPGHRGPCDRGAHPRRPFRLRQSQKLRRARRRDRAADAALFRSTCSARSRSGELVGADLSGAGALRRHRPRNSSYRRSGGRPYS